MGLNQIRFAREFFIWLPFTPSDRLFGPSLARRPLHRPSVAPVPAGSSSRHRPPLFSLFAEDRLQFIPCRRPSSCCLLPLLGRRGSSLCSCPLRLGAAEARRPASPPVPRHRAVWCGALFCYLLLLLLVARSEIDLAHAAAGGILCFVALASASTPIQIQFHCLVILLLAYACCC